MNPGIHHDIRSEEYHGYFAASASGWKTFADCAAKVPLPSPDPTPALIEGAAFHDMVLLPEVAAQEYAVAPRVDRRTKAGKAEYAEWLEENEGKTVLTADVMHRLDEMVGALKGHELVTDLLSGGVPEVSAFWDDPEHGFPCKARPDYLRDDMVVIDIKTCQSANKQNFEKAIANFRYHWQAWWYLRGLTSITGIEHKHFIFIAIEKTPPYAIAIYRADEEMLAVAEVEVQALLPRWAECVKTNNWPGHPEVIQTASLPGWAVMMR